MSAVEVLVSFGAVALIVALCVPGCVLLAILASSLWDDFGPARKR